MSSLVIGLRRNPKFVDPIAMRTEFFSFLLLAVIVTGCGPAREHQPRPGDDSASAYTRRIQTAVRDLAQARTAAQQIQSARKLVKLCTGQKPERGTIPKVLVVPLDARGAPTDWLSLATLDRIKFAVIGDNVLRGPELFKAVKINILDTEVVRILRYTHFNGLAPLP